MKKTKAKQKRERGITLIALVITIIILIILATVTITLVFGEGGLIQRAREGKQLTEQAQIDEQDELKGTEEYINSVLAGTGTTNPPEEGEEEPTIPPEPEIPTMEDAKPNPNEDGPKYESTTTITDDLDNPVTIPGGFHLDKDSGTKVEEGIVIEDDDGNQFVWIPVGEYNVSATINSTGKLTNELARRTFTSTGSTPISGDSVIESYYYGEGDSRSIAKDQIGAFKTSSTENKGFYIGRYEQGAGNVCKENVSSYVNVNRNQAKQQAEAMYNGNGYVTSQLISSYAWDTALNFICQTNTDGYLLSTNVDSSIDDYNKIKYLLNNCYEWTSEYCGFSRYDCVYRGGKAALQQKFAAGRGYFASDISTAEISFRVQLYINPEN